MHASHAHISAAPPRTGVFDEILGRDVSVLAVRRELCAPEAEALARVAQGPRFEQSVPLDTDNPDLEALLEPISDPVARRFLADDVTSLTRAYGALLQRRHVHAQLAVMVRDGCRKFHVDHVSLRLLCTYAGPATQWLRDADVVRANLGRIDVSIEDANRSVLREEGTIQQCETGAVLLLKGEVFHGNEGLGAVHRSPPIESDGVRRLVFKLDESPCGC